MIRPEYSFERDLSYSTFHKTLSSICYAMNLDWIEYRWINGKLKIVALIEDKDNRANIQNWYEKKKPIFMEVANALNIPAYLVLHNCCMQESHRELWRFRVINLKTDETKVMNEQEYRKFIENL